jgi:hypothetical protein
LDNNKSIPSSRKCFFSKSTIAYFLTSYCTAGRTKEKDTKKRQKKTPKKQKHNEQPYAVYKQGTGNRYQAQSKANSSFFSSSRSNRVTSLPRNQFSK